MKSTEKAVDDLTAIRGIGPIRQRWLRESLHVHTYLDLTSFPANEIEARLKADGQQVPPRSAIEKWLVEAHELAAEAGQPSMPELEAADNSAVGEANSLKREDGWRPFASFVVEFQTRDAEVRAKECRTAVHHMERDSGTNWPSIEGKLLCQWMMDQIRDEAGLAPEECVLVQAGPGEVPPSEEPSARVKISRIRVFQSPQSETPIHTIEAGMPFQGSVKGDEPFTIEVDFELTGTAVSDAGEQLACNAQSYAYNKANRKSTHLGDSEPRSLEDGKHAHTFTLPKVAMQEGDYCLWIVVTSGGALPTPDFIEVPEFQVI